MDANVPPSTPSKLKFFQCRLIGGLREKLAFKLFLLTYKEYAMFSVFMWGAAAVFAVLTGHPRSALGLSAATALAIVLQFAGHATSTLPISL